MRKLLFLLFVALIGFGAWFAWETLIHWTPPRADYPVQGIAVSEANGAVSWPGVATDGADFAYIGATRGAAERDIAFARNARAAKAAGLRYGAVHRYDLCRLADEQAANFVSTVPRDADALPPAVRLDFDESCAERPTRALVLSELETFLAQIEAHSEKPAILAVGDAFEAEYGVTGAVARTVWVKGNFLAPDYSEQPWVLWTANAHRRVAGIEGPVDWAVVRP